MSSKKLFSAALVTGSLLVGGVAGAATLVTLNPSANNNGAGVLSAANGPFQATGFQSNMTASLVASGNAGIVNVSETGLIDLTCFSDAGGCLPLATHGVGSSGNYRVQAGFTLTGQGSWAGTQLNLIPAGASLTLNVLGYPCANLACASINLGTATLAPGPTVAFAIAFGSVAPGSTGVALTSLSATLDFTPAAGTTGPNGFFQLPDPFLIDLAVGNAGGNTLNTGYAVDAAGVVTFTVPVPGTNPGTANVTFVAQVPEPGMLSLAGLALIAAGAAARRRTKQTA